MEITWFIVLVSISIVAFFSCLTRNFSKNLPPSPPAVPIIGHLLWLIKPQVKLELMLRNLHEKYGPIFTLYIGPKPAIFIATRSLAHQALVQSSAVFADRPPVSPTAKIISCNQHNINSTYGPKWRLFRRNITSHVLSRSRIKAYSHARKWVLKNLVDRLHSHSQSGAPVRVVDHLRYSMFCSLALMCFGEKLEEKQINEIERVLHRLPLNLSRFEILNFWPRFGKILFRKRWEELFQILQDIRNVLIPFIKARQKLKEDKLNTSESSYLQKDPVENEDEHVQSYVDTLLDLQLPEENNRKLEYAEIVALCSEFLDAGTDTSSTALQWIMANLVKYPQVQEKLFMEMKEVLGDGEEEVREEDLQRLPYLKAVTLEGLRRHPPAHFLLPHAVTQDTMLNGFVVPKDGVVNFMVAEMGLDPKVWKDPMAFKPERFLDISDQSQVFDITGNRELKMIPFGAGRRICPGYSIAMLHMEYFVANLVRKFKWKAVEGDDVDLTEKEEFTIVMKYPLKAHLSPRDRRE
ncbi:hypothetical protein ACOSQ2_014273 [Xanthoceras sorbifolium]|uniref:Cytochrome P450 n=1 Tax=Xanthoceras sorbifolium TaxID=99658 RepID=A0ABQ8I542_9ROSI|nr:hypothetical protein JRO89_XS04G0060300 [Xanthoceras sorbifolium]